MAAPSCLLLGGSGALGRAVARELARRGYDLLVHYCTGADRAGQVARECIESGAPNARTVQCDLADADATRRMLSQDDANGRPVSALVCAAGIGHDETLFRTPPERFDRIIAVNLTGVARALRIACTGWTDRNVSGHAVLVGSYAGMAGRSHASAYSASKAGLVGLMRSVARELGRDAGIRVNLVVPPFMPEGMGATASAEFAERAATGSVLGRTGSTTGCARVIAALLDTEDVSGQVISADSRIW